MPATETGINIAYINRKMKNTGIETCEGGDV